MISPQLRALAQAFQDGDESAREPLYDLLCEYGLPNLSQLHLIKCKGYYCKPGPGLCSLVENILTKTDHEHLFKQETVFRLARMS